MLTCARCSATLGDAEKTCHACGEPVRTAEREVKIIPAKAPPSPTIPKIALFSAASVLHPTEEMQAISAPPEPEAAFADTAFARVPTSVGGAAAPATKKLNSDPPPVVPSQLSPMAKSQIVSAKGGTVAMPSITPQSPASPSQFPSQSPPRSGTAALPSRPRIPASPGSSGNLPVVSKANPNPAVAHPSSASASRVGVGAVVFVKWSNGQKYRGTVSQVYGPRALVAFPDGQQHWVEMQYLSLA